MPFGAAVTRALMAALLITSAVLMWEGRSLKAARADLATVQAQLEGYKELDKFRLKQQAAALQAAALDTELSMGVGADAPLSDYLRGAAVRVWP